MHSEQHFCSDRFLIFLVMFIIECGFSVIPHQEIFKNRDTDNSGTMSSHEMRDAVKEAGNESVRQTIEDNELRIHFF